MTKCSYREKQAHRFYGNKDEQDNRQGKSNEK